MKLLLHATEKTFAAMIAIVLMGAPVVHAQENAALQIEQPVPVEAAVTDEIAQAIPPTPTQDVTSVSLEGNPVLEAGESEPPSETVIVQETETVQVVVGGEALESTVDPVNATSTTEAALIPVEAASTTDVAVIVTTEEIEPILSEIVDEVAIEPTEPDVVAEVSAESVAAVEAVALESAEPELLPEPEPSYVFELSGKTIEAELENGVEKESVTASANNAEGVLNVSGTCDDVYYVVLLYKNAADYEINRSSYVVNRAYECENGSYSYDIDRIPPSVTNGTYYLLIGEQGERGTWRPVTSLTEIVINRSN